MTLDQYITNINQRFKLGNATEHTFRGDLQTLIESIVPSIKATNEPKRQKCGAPDYILTRKEIPVGFIEAKDIGDKDLKGEKKNGNKEQFDRYKSALNPIIFTDYLDFYLYKNGELVAQVAIGQITDKGIVPLKENFATFENLLKDFCATVSQNIKSPQKLAQMMAAKARLLADVIEKALISDEESQQNSSLKDQMKAFQLILIHDISPKSFADVYAQTIAYGMFAARLHDPTLEDFSRQEAYELIPKSNPFLKKLFGYIAGLDLDDRIKWIVDSLVEIFLACNVEEILKNYGKATKQEEPIIHFYETFLSEYDPNLRKARGVWYTPAPVVNFIVRAVDDILKSDFALPQGLADTSKTKIKIPLTDNKGKQVLVDKEVHRVQILDPATGTGTFLAEVVKHINKRFAGQKGIWSSYVEKELLPRLNGFELLMASYAMAHLQLDILLRETGYKPTPPKGDGATPPFGHPSKGGESIPSFGGAGVVSQRLRIFLTNSLEEASNEVPNLFMAQWLTEEAQQANSIKKDTPVMCVIGNPPYAVSSTNKSEWIQNLIADYKKDLNERKINLDDDYIKFIRYGQHFIDKNGSGVLAYISNNSFIDGITHRQMRKHLLESFDTIYVLDLHGNAKKKEVCPDGSPDQNVFDIMQGVSINIFVKTGKKKAKELAQVLHYDLQGKREAKYDFLNTNSLKSLVWNQLSYSQPNYFFVPKNFEAIEDYAKGFKLDELQTINSNGIETKCDSLSIHFSKESLVEVINDFKNFDINELKKKYNDKEDSSGWTFAKSKKSLMNEEFIYKKIHYRPFDFRETVITRNSGGFIGRSRYEVMQHLLKPNLCLIIPRQTTQDYRHSFITNIIFEGNITASAKLFGTGCGFPLYLYPDTSGQLSFEQTAERKPNLNEKIVAQIAEGLGLRYVIEKAHTPPIVESNFPSFGGVPEGRGGHTHIHNIPIQRNFVQNLPYNSQLSQLAKDKRKAGILSEVLFWQQVHKGKFHKIDFDRQRIIGNFIVDFYVKTLGLVVEIDGSSHDNKQDYDMARQAYLENLGLRVYRIRDIDVKKNIADVMLQLELYIVSEYGGEETTPPYGHPSKGGEVGGEFTPLDILDYIYAVLHSPTYRETYKEFLKIDFPRVPYPTDAADFWAKVAIGAELRQIHLLESPKVEEYITQYPEDGDNVVRKIRFVVCEDISTTLNDPTHNKTAKGKVYINETQYFDAVPEVAWNFYIGGYQPAQKWLKDRKERELSFEDILHYQKIIVALAETDRLMQKVDKV